MRGGEDYVRPPLLAHEPLSPAAARRRFRLVAGLLFLLLVGGVAALLYSLVFSGGEGNPGLNPQGLHRPAAVTNRR